MLPKNNQSQKVLTVVSIVCVIILVFFGVYSLIASRHFHITSTSPNTKKVATISPYLKINFSKPLADQKVVITSSYSVAKSYNISGKTLTVTLDSPTTADYKYWIKIKSISSKHGEKITNETLVFTPKNIDYTKLPQEQQDTILNNQLKAQQNHAKTKDDLSYKNFDGLLNIGISNTEVESLKQDFFTFKPKAYSVTLDSILSAPHDRFSTSNNDSVTFNAKIDNTLYQANFTYSNLDNSTRLQLLSSGNQVYDSGTVTPNTGE